MKWIKSSRSTNVGECVEVAWAPATDETLVRDSKDPSGSWFRFTRAEWDAFLHGVKNGEFDQS